MNTTTDKTTRQIRRDHARKLEFLQPIRVKNQCGSTYVHHLLERRHTEHADIEITVDWDALFLLLGDKAIRSKGGKAVEAGGAVVARVIGPRTSTDEVLTKRPLSEHEAAAAE